jgi:hypothetical protein
MRQTSIGYVDIYFGRDSTNDAVKTPVKRDHKTTDGDAELYVALRPRISHRRHAEWQTLIASLGGEHTVVFNRAK